MSRAFHSRCAVGAVGLALLVSMIGLSACSNASPGEGQVRTQPAQPAPGTTRPQGESNMTASSASSSTQGLSILGFRLGGPYQDAVAAAAGRFTLTETGPEDHRGRGELDGVPAVLTLAGRGGRLVDMQIEWQLEVPDPSLDASAPLALVEKDLGRPAELSDDVASWEPRGFEITLQRSVVHVRGERGPRIEYRLRARTAPVSAGVGDPAEAGDKDREAGGQGPR